MTIAALPKRLGFFTRLLDQADPTERYRLATAQIIHAERFGFDSAWIAQHHFHEDEGGLPAPFVFLAQVAAQTSRIRLGTAIVTLPLELPIRVAEDSAVLDLMCGGRLEVGVGGGGNLSSYAAFGQNSAERATLLAGHLQVLRDAWPGRHRARLVRLGRATGDGSLDAMITAMDVHLGTPDDVIASLQTDSPLARATDVAVQVHSIDPPHPFILRSIELVAEVVAPALGWGRHAAGVRRVA